MGKSNRIRADRSTKTAQKKGMPSWLISLIAIGITVAVLATVALGILSSNGIFNRYNKAMATENFSFSTNMMSYLFFSQYNSMMQTGSSSIDTTKSLKSQTYSEGVTWYDYFMSEAKSQAEYLLVFAEYALENGMEITDEDKDAIDAEIDALRTEAAGYGYSLNNYIPMTYGSGVKVSDIKKILKITALASKGVNDLQTKLADGITDEDIQKAYDENKDKFDLIDYIYYSFSTSYDAVTKEVLNKTEYTKEEQNAKKDEIDAKYKEKLEEAEKLGKELEAITDRKEFANYIINHITNNNFDTEFNKLELNDNDKPSDETKAKIKEEMVKAVVKDIADEKAETAKDSVKDGDNYTIYGESVSATLATKLDTMKNTLFKNSKTAFNSYIVEESTLNTSDFSKWAFEAGRKVGDIKSIINDTNKDEKFSHTVYMLDATRYINKELTKNIAYMLFTTEDAAKAAIEKLGAEESLTLERFEELATELSAASNSTLEDYVEGGLSDVSGFDDWAYAEDIAKGAVTETPIKVDDANYLVAFYHADGKEAWTITVKSDIYSERYEAEYEALTAKYAVTAKDKALNKISA